MSQQGHFSAKRLTTDGVSAALFFVLSLLNIEIGGLKFTLDALPVTVAALLFGPVDGLLVGAVGAFLEQLLRYGLTATTVLWIMPAACRGLLLGLFLYGRKTSPLRSVLCFTGSGLAVSLLNTAVYYLDSRLFGYYNPALIFGVLGWRLIIGAVISVLLGLLATALVRGLNRAGLGEK